MILSAPRKILIVDDEPENLETIAGIFEKECHSHAVLKAPNGKVALKILEQRQADLIITDWEMPEMDGIELIRNLKQNPKTEDIPVIMCTGIMLSSENLETALNAGAIDYIRKPIDKIELIARTRANLHLADSYKRIKLLNEAKDKIFSIISHDLRGPVGNIKSFTQFVVEEQNNYSNKELVDIIEMIGKTNTSMLSVLENLLQWANAQRRDIHFLPYEQTVNNVIAPTIELLSSLAEQKGISIINQIATEQTAYFDATLIATVVRNLIGNALKFTHRNGCITIQSEISDCFVTVSVCDNGVGIPPEKIDTIFDKTSYHTTFGTNHEKGSGLGLKLCVEFIEKHNGKIWVESKNGEGSCFRFALPLKKNSPVAE